MRRRFGSEIAPPPRKSGLGPELGLRAPLRMMRPLNSPPPASAASGGEGVGGGGDVRASWMPVTRSSPPPRLRLAYATRSRPSPPLRGGRERSRRRILKQALSAILHGSMELHDTRG